MNSDTLKSILEIGENVAIEFKRCGNGVESDVYESICSFSNRFGGDLFMGVLDNGAVLGVPEKTALDMIKNFISVISNPSVFSPTIYLQPALIDYEGRTVIHVHVPPSAEVHSYKKAIYDRIEDADVKVTSTSQIAAMYIRKQNIFTEKKIYPFVKPDHLRLDLLPKVRQLAINHAGGAHPWKNMDDIELLKSAGLYGMSLETGEEGYNLAALMLLGRDEIILNACPAYTTDALLRKANVDRYDDREIIRTNLIESYEQLMAFGRKHLPDKFFLEDTYRLSLRNTIVREMIGNTLIHREFTSSYTAKFVIEKNRMYVENANRAARQGVITPDNLEPNPKNPVIAAFFRNIGFADQLGSGVRNLFKYTKFYSGKDPELIEDDVFKIIVPLDDMYSYDLQEYSENTNVPNAIGKCRKVQESAGNYKGVPESPGKCRKLQRSAGNYKEVPEIPGKHQNKPPLNKQEQLLVNHVLTFNKITTHEACRLLGVKERRARIVLKQLVDKGILKKQGASKTTEYIL